MIDDRSVDYLEMRLEDVESIAELQAYVAATSNIWEEPPSEPVDTVGEKRVMGGLEKWLAALRTKLADLAEREGAKDYQLAVSAGTTGLSVTVSVTYSGNEPQLVE